MSPLTVDLRSSLDELPKLQAFLAESAARFHIPAPVVGQLELALEEVVTNVISYAFDELDSDGGGHGHVIRVAIGVEGRDITVTVEDNGAAFDPLDRAAPDVTVPIEEREVGGLGILLVRELMDDVRYDRVGDRNRLTLTKTMNESITDA